MDVVDRSSTVLPGAVEQTVEPGEILLREGETDDSIFEVVDGTFEILRGDDLERIATVGPGETLGEIAALGPVPAHGHRPGNLAVHRSARRSTDLWRVARGARRPADAGHRARPQPHRPPTRHRPHHRAARRRRQRRRRGRRAGRLVAPRAGRSAVRRGRRVRRRLPRRQRPPHRLAPMGTHVGEVGRGEVVGEIGLIERTARSATVVALRETTLARFSVDAFRSLAAEHPALMLQLSRTILARIGRPANLTDRARSIAVAITAPLDTRLTTTVLAQELARHGTTRHLWAARIDAALGPPGARRVRACRHGAGAVGVHPGRRDRARLPPAGDRRRRLPVDPPGAVPRRPDRRGDVGEPARRRAPAGRRRSSPRHPRTSGSSAGWRWSTRRRPSGRVAPQPSPTASASTGSPTSGAARSPISADSPGWCPATPRDSSSVAAAPGASPTSACGGRSWSSVSTSTPSVGRRSAHRSAPAWRCRSRPVISSPWPPSCSTTSSTTRCRSSR